MSLAVFGDQTVWIVARSTGVASLVALSLSLLTGMALRPKCLTRLSTNRAVAELHKYMTVLFLPLGLATSSPSCSTRTRESASAISSCRSGSRTAPWPSGSARSACSCSSSSCSPPGRRRLSRGRWLAFHRLSYLAFAAAFLHGILPGTDLAYPWLAGLAWLAVAVLVLAGLQRAREALPARFRGVEGADLTPAA
jgi:hypothetical protein